MQDYKKVSMCGQPTLNNILQCITRLARLYLSISIRYSIPVQNKTVSYSTDLIAAER